MIVSNLKTGDILLYRSNSLLSRLIRYFSGKYSHAGLVMDSWGKLFIAEADKEGVVANKVEQSIKGCEILVLRPKYQFDPKTLNQLITSTLGKHEYGFWKLLVVQLVWQVSGKKWWIGSNDNHNLKRAICGEYVCYIYHILSDEQLFKDWYKATPQSIFETDLYEHFNLITL